MHPGAGFLAFFESNLNYLNLCKHEEGLLSVLGVTMKERGREHLIPGGLKGECGPLQPFDLQGAPAVEQCTLTRALLLPSVHPEKQSPPRNSA